MPLFSYLFPEHPGRASIFCLNSHSPLASVTTSLFIGTLITYPKCQAPWTEFLGLSTCTTISSLTWGFAHLFSSLSAIINMVIFPFPVTSLMQNGERSGENRHQQREVAESTRFLSLYSLFPSFLSWASQLFFKEILGVEYCTFVLIIPILPSLGYWL